MINRSIAFAALPIAVLSLFASARSNADSERNPIATTARIIKINAKTKTMVVRSEVPADAAPQRVEFRVPGMMIPGGISIAVPAKTWDYTVVTTSETAFQDGIDALRFEDFKSGETISIHGVLSGKTLTATRVAKWG